MKVLIIEDELQLRIALKESLVKEQYVVEEASSYSDAADKIWSYDYDCILLDVMLPDGNGLKLLEQLREMKKGGSVIIISAKDSLDDKLAGLGLGADDYLTKPFHIAELNVRIKNVLRRNTYGGDDLLHYGNVQINITNRSVSVAGQQLTLHPKEFDSLNYFLLNKERLVSKTSLAEHVWGDYIDQSNDFEFVYSQIKNLRKKLRDANATVELQSVYGMGYKLTQP